MHAPICIHRINIRVINENPWSNLFANNMFPSSKTGDSKTFNRNMDSNTGTGFKADPKVDGTRQENFCHLFPFTHKTIIDWWHQLYMEK
jgi:phosphoenolpyruvate carboxykinase (ATP)